MHRLGLMFLAATMVAVPYVAFSQESAQEPPASADDYVCALTDECQEGAEAQVDSTGRARVTATRGFSLSRPTPPSNATDPAPKASPPPAAPRRATPRPPRGQTAAATQQRRVDLRLSFGLGSAVLSSGAQQQLRAFAEALRRPQLANSRVRIEGHTDASGGRQMNLALSQRRAQAAADFLMSQGVAANRLEVRGYAFDRPLPGRPATAQENRRVEAVRIS